MSELCLSQHVTFFVKVAVSQSQCDMSITPATEEAEAERLTEVPDQCRLQQGLVSKQPSLMFLY